MKIRYDREIDALVVDVDGELSFVVYKKTVDEILKSPLFRPGINVLYDLRQASGISLTTEDIKLVALHGKSIAHLRGPSWKAAIVVSGILEYGLGRMFETITSEAPFKVRVFRREGDARMWLRRGGDQDAGNNQ